MKKMLKIQQEKNGNLKLIVDTIQKMKYYKRTENCANTEKKGERKNENWVYDQCIWTAGW